MPTLRKLYKMSHIEDEIEDTYNEFDETEIVKYIRDYYRNNGDLYPSKYQILKNGSVEFETYSLTGRHDGSSPRVESVSKAPIQCTEFDERILKKIGLNMGEVWNGEMSSFRYDDGDVIIGKTDYFTVTPFSRLLSSEIALEMDNGKTDIQKMETPIRDKYMSKISDFHFPCRPRNASTSGIILANNGDEYVFLIGKRSENVERNRGLYSLFPSGAVVDDGYDNFYNIFKKNIKKEFVEELFGNTKEGENFYKKNVKTFRISRGWDLRDGSLFIGNIIILDSVMAYDVFMSMYQRNNESSQIIEVPIKNISDLKTYISMNKMSANTISTVFEALSYIKSTDKYQNLPYDINRIDEE